jgi:hypothetical protein
LVVSDASENLVPKFCGFRSSLEQVVFFRQECPGGLTVVMEKASNG